MGVYLPNVNMPKDDKVVTIQICPDGSIWQQYRGTVPNAKAIPVPPHGRLCDMDVLKETIGALIKKHLHGYTKSTWDFVCELRSIISDAPTIIPAETCKEKGE